MNAFWKKQTYQRSVGLAMMLLLSGVMLTGCETSETNVIHQKSIQVLNEKAQEYVTGGQPLKAIARLESALELDPNQKETLNNLAIVYHSAERYEEAVQSYEKLILLDAANEPSYHKSLGIAYEAWGDQVLAKADSSEADKTQALAHYEQAIENYQKIPEDKRVQTQIKALQDHIAQLQSGQP